MSDNNNDIDDELVGDDLSHYSEEEWLTATKLRSTIEELLSLPRLTASDVESAAAKHEISRSWLYALIGKFKAEGSTSCLIPKKPTGGKGKSRLPVDSEHLIQEIIETAFLTSKKLKPSQVIREYKLACRRRGIKPVAENTVRARISAIPGRVATKHRHGGHEARDKYDPVTDEFPRPKWPLGVVQMDHTPTDIVVVDEELRQPIGRLNLTIAVDMYSRAILGYLMSLEAPSATTVALCLAHTVVPKVPWLQERGIDADWPMFGKPDVLHVDNGPDFKSEALKRGCEEHNIQLQHRPVKHPKYGGTVERLFRTLNGVIHSLDGTTKSNTSEKGKNYNPDKEAALTMAELERCLVIAITEIYHEDVHSKLLIPPRLAWEEGIYGVDNQPGRGLPQRVQNERRFVIDFLPMETRSIQRYGFVWDHIKYYDPVLRPYIDNEDKRKFIIRRDPRDISKVYFYCPDTARYFEIPYRNLDNPTITLWEFTAARERLRQKGLDASDEDRIFDAYEEIQAELQEARVKTKRARRSVERTRSAKVSHTRLRPEADVKPASVREQAEDQPAVPATDDDDFDFNDTFGDIKHL